MSGRHFRITRVDITPANVEDQFATFIAECTERKILPLVIVGSKGVRVEGIDLAIVHPSALPEKIVIRLLETALAELKGELP